jgi:lactate dehydrogenase-like 2-hydroxyacid dehydrogenase
VADKDITILIAGKLHDHAIDKLSARFRTIRIETGDAALVPEQERANVRAMAVMAAVTPDFIDAFANLEMISSFGVGYDHVDAKYAASKGIVVTNTPDVLTEEVADTAVGLLLNTVRELSQAEAWLREGNWLNGAYPLTRGTLRERTVGIFGMGRIGQAIATRLAAFGLPISYHNRRKVDGVPYAYHASLIELARSVDTLVSVAPGGASTEKAVNRDVLEALGPDGVFVNIGRGSTVDEDALAAALADGTIMAAGLDVFADEPRVPEALMKAPNAVLLPHVGSASLHTRKAMGALVADNVTGWFDDGRVLTPVPESAQLNPAGS